MTNKQIEIPVKNASELTFGGLGIAPKMLETISKLGFITPTSIQHKAIPVAIEGKDIIGIAQTGTGKTLAFGIPLIQQLLTARTGRGLIILPTRELALQVNETIQKIGRNFGIKTAVLIGGSPIRAQMRELSYNPHVVIGTPGRINDHIQQRTLNLSNASILVLDEADRMFDMGFAPQINKILLSVPKNRQTMLFSATMPEGIVKIATHQMKLPIRVEIARAGTTAENIEQELFVVKKDQKLSLLKKIVQDYKGSILIFIRVKHGARKICMNLKDIGVSSTEIHSNRSQNQRKEALEGFKTGKYRVLVATDIASRGIDVKNIELVINYDLPEQAEDYVHRIGRTGRAGLSGKAISFAMPDQGSLVREIEMLTRINLPISQLPADLPKSAPASFEKRDFSPNRGRRSSPRYGYARRR